MAKSNNQKMKILYLLELFQNPASSGMVFPMQEIVAILAEKGIRAERKSIYDDFEALRAFGVNIRFRKERPSGYYLAGEKELQVPVPKVSRIEGYLLAEDEGEKKELKLSCTEEGKKAVLAAFGEECPCKLKEGGRYQIQIQVPVGLSLYGWLLAHHNEVRFQKPKKEAAAYRDYLKEISKTYKI